MDITKPHCLICCSEITSADLNSLHLNLQSPINNNKQVICESEQNNFKRILHQHSNKKRNVNLLCKRFCTLSTRYFNLPFINCFNFEPQNTISDDVDKNKNNSEDEELQFKFELCDNCAKLVADFCDLYDLWSGLELQLNSTASQISKVIMVMKESEKLDNQRQCVTNPLTESFRKNFLAKANAKNLTRFPQLRLKKVDVTKPGNFSSSQMARHHIDVKVEPEICQTATVPNINFGNGSLPLLKTETPTLSEEGFVLNVDDDDEDPEFKIGEETSEQKNLLNIPSFETILVDPMDTETYLEEDEEHEHDPLEVETKSDDPYHNSLDLFNSNSSNSEIPQPKTILLLKCTFCPKTYANPTSLKQHERVHVSGREPRFECDVCGLKFDLLKQRVLHRRTMHGNVYRTKVTDYSQNKCATCGSEFSDISTLRKHEKIHSGVKEFECGVCGRKFLLKHHLQRHEMIHRRQEKCFNCGICGERFIQMASCRSHQLEAHGTQDGVIVNTELPEQQPPTENRKKQRKRTALPPSLPESVPNLDLFSGNIMSFGNHSVRVKPEMLHTNFN